MELRTRRRFVRTACLLARARLRAERAGATVHHGRVDDLHRAVRAVQASAADLRAEDRHRGARRGARHGPGARPRAPRRRGRGLRAREISRRAILERGPRRAALSRHVQRLRHHRAESGPGRNRAAATTRSTRSARSRTPARRSCRAATAAARTSRRSTSGRWRASTSPRKKARGIARPGKAWGPR